MQATPPILDSPSDLSPLAIPTSEILTLDVGGMKCAGCVKAVENQLTRQVGVLSATVNLATEVASVNCETGRVDPVALAQRLTAAGFPSQPRTLGTPTATDSLQRQRLETRKRLWQLAIATLLLVLSGIGHLHQLGWLTIPGLSNIGFHWGLATIALLVPGRSILGDGWRGLRRNAPNMNTLVGLGTITAYAASLIALLFPSLGWECFFDEPVMLVGFILLGRALEQSARSKAAASLQTLMSLQPTTARLVAIAANSPGHSPDLTSDRGIEIPVESVKVGEGLQILPGEKLPVDGKVVLGQSTVDESLLTGESLPVLKQPGDSVVAGSLNLSGVIVMQATRTGSHTTLSQIISLVETAQTRKAPIQGLADRIAGYFTYGVMAIALCTFLFWYGIGIPLWGDGLISHATAMMGHSHAMLPAASGQLSISPLLLSLKLSIAVLVIACPCALGLATPTALLVGSGIGAERGLLIRGGDVLEKVHQLKTVVFDKTGTLTIGKPTVTDCLSLSDRVSSTALLQLAATVEGGTQHPLASAIEHHAQAQNLTLLPAYDFQTVPGLGIAAMVSYPVTELDGIDPDPGSELDPASAALATGIQVTIEEATVKPTAKATASVTQKVIIGTQSWLQQNGIHGDETVQLQAQHLEQAGKTVVYVGVNSDLNHQGEPLGHQAGNEPKPSVIGLIAVQDTLRQDAKSTIDRLKSLGLRVLMLTGDQPLVADAIAEMLDLDPQNVFAGVRPDQKAALIQTLQQETLAAGVAMIGDGINDAPALAQADVGIALHSSTDVAIESAGIVLMRDRLSDVVAAIQLSRSTFRKIQQNLFWAFIYNLLGIPIAAGLLLPLFGWVLSPATAGALMAFSSVSVVTNSLLLRRTWR